MKTAEKYAERASVSRRELLLLPFALWGANVLANTDTEEESGITPIPIPHSGGVPAKQRWAIVVGVTLALIFDLWKSLSCRAGNIYECRGNSDGWRWWL